MNSSIPAFIAPAESITQRSVVKPSIGGSVFAAFCRYVKVYVVPLGHAAVTAGRGERGEVNEHVLASRLLLNEAVALRVVKPLDSPRHLLCFLPASQRRVERQSVGFPADNGWTKLWSHTRRASISAGRV